MSAHPDPTHCPPPSAISERYRRVHIDGDRSRPIAYQHFARNDEGPRIMRAIAGAIGLVLLILAAIVAAVAK